MLLLITVMCVITEKKMQLNIASLRCHNFYHWWYFNWGGEPGPLGSPLATPMMTSVEIALVCGLKIRVGCQDRLCVNSNADETLA